MTNSRNTESASLSVPEQHSFKHPELVLQIFFVARLRRIDRPDFETFMEIHGNHQQDRTMIQNRMSPFWVTEYDSLIVHKV
jgi:hypothetical protein